MLQVEVKVVDARYPVGHPDRIKVIATAEIVNMGTNNAGRGNDNPLGDYAGTFTLHGEPWRREFVFNYDRLRLPVWVLLYRLLRSILQGRQQSGEGREGQHDGRHTEHR